MNNEIKFLPPFKRMCMSIGTLPSSFYASMSYYESMVWLYEYLKNEVIPVVNNNSEVTEELQTAFTQLEEYIRTYFDNLDIQHEVDVKLDEMALDGTLADMIAEYIKMQGQLVYDSVADMKAAENIQNGSFLRTYGYYTYNDGGGALYKARTVTNEDVPDDATIIALHDVTLVAELITNEINVLQFGCYGDGTHDDTTNFNKALDYARTSKLNIISPENKTYLISSSLDMSNVNVDMHNSTIITSSNINMILIDSGYMFGSIKNVFVDCNGYANSGLYINSGRNYVFNNIQIDNINIYGIYYDVGYENHFSDIWIHSKADNANGIGIYAKGSDSHFSNIILRDCHVGIKNNGTNWYNNVHGWLGGNAKSVYYQSRLIEITDGIFQGSQILSDTYHWGIYLNSADGTFNINNFEYIQLYAIVSTVDLHGENIYTVYQSDSAITNSTYCTMTGVSNAGIQVNGTYSAFSNKGFRGKVVFTKSVDLNINALTFNLTAGTGVTLSANNVRNHNDMIEMYVVGSVDLSQVSDKYNVILGTLPAIAFYPKEIINYGVFISTDLWSTTGVSYLYINNSGQLCMNLGDKSGTIYFKIFMNYMKRN